MVGDTDSNQWDAMSCLVVIRAIRNVKWAGDSVCVCRGWGATILFYFAKQTVIFYFHLFPRGEASPEKSEE